MTRGSRGQWPTGWIGIFVPDRAGKERIGPNGECAAGRLDEWILDNEIRERGEGWNDEQWWGDSENR